MAVNVGVGRAEQVWRGGGRGGGEVLCVAGPGDIFRELFLLVTGHEKNA